MGQALKPGRCVHCLQGPVPLSRDHVFPKSWYPDNAKLNLWKWQIPACHPCNTAYGAMEAELLVHLGLCVEPDVAEASGIMARAMRAIDASGARGKRDALARDALRKKILGNVLEGAEIPTESVYPGFEERWGRTESEQVGLRIPKASFERLTQKIVRGIYYLRDGAFIEPPYSIIYYALRGPAEWEEFLNRHGEAFAHEPGIRVIRAVAREDPFASLFEIEIWRTFKMHASLGRDTDGEQGAS